MIDTSIRLVSSAFNLLSQRLSIVLFHRVLAEPDTMLPDVPDQARFAEQVRWLRAAFTVLPLQDAVARLFEGRLPPGALCITFDDGYADNASNALPVLAELDVPATFFVTTRYIDQGLMWNDRVIEAVRVWPHASIDLDEFGIPNQSVNQDRASTANALLDMLKYQPFEVRDAIADELFQRSGSRVTQLMMDPNQIRTLHQAGMEIGGHTISHPILSTLSSEQAYTEISENKRVLEEIIEESVTTFAYPNGRPRSDYDARHISMLKECGYHYALTTASGTASSGSSPYQLPRFTPWDLSKSKYLARMLVNYFKDADQVAEPRTAAPGE